MTEQDILKRIYPSIVTFASDWRKQAAEVKKLELKEISLFLTDTDFGERRQIYQALEKTKVKKIPHIHLRHGMKESELDYLAGRYQTEVFVIHFQYFKDFKNSKHKKRLFIESNRGPGLIKSLKPFAEIGGICLDLSHLAMFEKTNPEAFKMAVLTAKKYPVGGNHLSAIKPDGKSWHYADKVSDLDYVKNIPRKYFSRCINLELGNSIKEQLEFKKYVAKILARAWK